MIRSIVIGLGVNLAVAVAASAQSTICVSSPQWLPLHGDALASSASISRNGRFIAFISESPALVPGDTNSEEDVFLYDRDLNSYDRITSSQPVSFVKCTAVSDDGRYVAYYASVYASVCCGTFVRDRLAGVDVFVNTRTDGTPAPETQFSAGRVNMTGDGRFVVFDSTANMMGDQGDLIRQIYLHDRDVDGNGIFDEPGNIKTVRMSVSSSGEPSNGESRYADVSSDGRFVTFSSLGTNLVVGDTNGDRDIFVHDRDPDGNGVLDEPGHILTERVSVATNGQQALGTSTYCSSISSDGRFVVFDSRATNLVPDDTNGLSDVFLHDRQSHETIRVSTAFDGSQSNGQAVLPEITDDGRIVVYPTSGTNVFTDDLTPSSGKVVVYDRLSRSKKRASLTYQNLPSTSSAGGDIKSASCMTPDARLVVFSGAWNDWVPYPTYHPSVYLRDRGPHYLADIDGAGTVNVTDLLAVITQWGRCPTAPVPCPADLNGDGTVNVADLLMVITNWG